jgi:HPt (histidine-containing phosphotransfer) domain-containing protein
MEPKPEHASPVLSLAEQEHFDLPTLMEHIDHDLDLLRLLLQSGDWDSLIALFRTAVLAGDRSEAAALAHRIKGSALNLHLPVLAPLAAEAEMTAKTASISLGSHLQSIETEWAILGPILSKVAKQLA